MSSSIDWYLLDRSAVLAQVGSGSNGLTDAEVLDRLRKNGRNELRTRVRRSPLFLFFGQFRDFMILVLLAAAIIAGWAGDKTDTIIILVIVLLNALIGSVQEYRAEKALDALRRMAAQQAVVIRGGLERSVSAAELVAGDIVVLVSGNTVPADLRLIECHGLQTDESALTGESVPVLKGPQVLEGLGLTLGDRLNMAYKGTWVTQGRGRGVVVATGMETELGRIASMLELEELATPLQKRMADFGRSLSQIILLICAVLFGAGLLRGEPVLDMLLVSISLAVAAIPEALPALITVSLALGARQLVRRNALVRRLPAVETLGSVSFICTDKTGTLTQNRMTVAEWMVPAGMDPLWAEQLLALNHDLTLVDTRLNGDPTEKALAEVFLQRHGLDDYRTLQLAFPRIAERPFDAERKCMTTVHRHDGRYLCITKGAAERIAGQLLHETERQQLEDCSILWSEAGMRVIAYGFRWLAEWSDNLDANALEMDLQWGGVAGLIDPPRPEACAAIRECCSAGIRPVMITGDHPATAASIARTIGILNETGHTLTGAELAHLSPKEFQDRVEDVAVYARVSPEQKLQIVKALQANGHFVAMTGDGVNDAPSLKAADIGVAMGITGTDVSREAADVVLLDDHFATIVMAVREGRRIYDNIRKFVKYIMTCNSAEIWTLFLAPLVGLPIPLLPIHILWINLVTDGLPGLALAGERAEKHIMVRPPRRAGESLFAGGSGFHIIWVGLLMAGVTLAMHAWTTDRSMASGQTMVFTVLSLSQLGHVLAIRSDREFLYRHGLFSNPWLLAAVAGTFLLQLVVIYLPVANRIFHTTPLTLAELALCCSVSAIVFHAVECEKWFRRLRTGQKKD